MMNVIRKVYLMNYWHEDLNWLFHRMDDKQRLYIYRSIESAGYNTKSTSSVFIEFIYRRLDTYDLLKFKYPKFMKELNV